VKAQRPLGRRPESVRRAVAKSRAARLRDVERRLVGHLAYLRRHDPDGHAANVGMLRRIIAHETRGRR
jgi:hypothetical protein